MRVEIVDRRDFLIGATASAALSIALAAPALAQDRPQTLDEALKKIMGDAKPTDGKITLELPEIAENGNTVPFTLAVDSPMTEANYVKALHIFAGSNPQVDVASFTFTPQSGKATASSRMRLAKTQEVVVVAELSDGKFLLGKRTVKVTIGGCGG
jgi:sulfur-oxidizing protein SoxY